MGRDNLIVRLRGEAQEQYRIFNRKFVLTNRNPMLGVKVPRIRAIAKEIAAGDWREFLQEYGFCCGGSETTRAQNGMEMCMDGSVGASHAQNPPGMCMNPDNSGADRLPRAVPGVVEEILKRCTEVFFEEIMIIGMVINLVNVAPGERLQLVSQVVPLIDNWAVCDVFCGGAKWVGEPGKGPKARNKVPREMVWEFLQGYLLGCGRCLPENRCCCGDGSSYGEGKQRGRTVGYLSGSREFEIRFGVVMLMSYFLVPEYLERVFEVLGKVRYGDYYVDMGVAWCLATARGKFDRQTQEFVARAGLPAGVIKKYEQKVRDSLRMRALCGEI